MGGIDDFTEVSRICKKYGMWMHIDGCWGAHLKWSVDGDKLFKGAELSDSFAMNAHKGFGVPQ